VTYLTKDSKPDATFLGIKIEGNYGGWSRAIQEPIENLYEYFKVAFEKYGVTAVMWEQYTPGFNDGDPCEFGVREPKITTNPVVAAAWLEESEPDMDLAYPGQDLYYDEYDFESSHHPDGDIMREIDVPVNAGRFEDALRGVFGNDTKVVVTPTRVVQFEYDCGY
jgi:hypothetical protein